MTFAKCRFFSPLSNFKYCGRQHSNAQLKQASLFLNREKHAETWVIREWAERWVKYSLYSLHTHLLIHCTVSFQKMEDHGFPQLSIPSRVPQGSFVCFLSKFFFFHPIKSLGYSLLTTAGYSRLRYVQWVSDSPNLISSFCFLEI